MRCRAKPLICFWFGPEDNIAQPKTDKWFNPPSHFSSFFIFKCRLPGVKTTTTTTKTARRNSHICWQILTVWVSSNTLYYRSQTDRGPERSCRNQSTRELIKSSKYETPVQQQRPESPKVTLT